MRRILVALALVFCVVRAASGQQAWLVTIGPGDGPEEVYGHSAIVIVTDRANLVYNWGVFDAHNMAEFIPQFLAGRMMYTMDASVNTLGPMRDFYRSRGRSMHGTRLDLSPTQVATLARLCEENDTPANRAYLYDYFRDNCATRIRDKIDDAVGGQVAAQLKPRETTHTFRYYTDAYAQHVPWVYVSLHYVLGHSIDRPLNQWQECFLPEVMEKNLGDVEITWEDGSKHKLLGGTQEFVPNTRGPFVAPPMWWPWFLLAGAAWGGAIWGLATFRLGRRWLMPLPLLAWELACVVAGGVSTFGWFFTDHLDSRNNENWLQLNPLSLPMLMVGILMLFGRRKRWMGYTAALPLALSLLGAAIKILPMMNQPNASIILLAVPVHAGVMLAARRTLRSTP